MAIRDETHPCGECGHEWVSHTSGIDGPCGCPNCTCGHFVYGVENLDSRFGQFLRWLEGKENWGTDLLDKAMQRFVAEEGEAEAFVPPTTPLDRDLPPSSNRACPACHTQLTWEDRDCWRCVANGRL